MGHAHRNVVLAVKKAAERGIHFGVATKSELDLAQEILKAFPCMERIRFYPSADAALNEALRLARAFTGRPLVVILERNNGLSGESGLIPPPPAGGHSAAGYPDGVAAPDHPQVVRLVYDAVGHLEPLLAPLKPQLAGIVVDPLSADNQLAVMGEEDLKYLRTLTKDYKSLMIINEINSGFRFRKGGLQEDVGVRGDLTCLGKIIGGGFPLGAVGGRRDILATVPAAGEGLTGGGFPAANPVIMRAGLSTLRLLNNDMYRSLESRTLNLADGLNAFLKAEDSPVRVSRAGSYMKLYSDAPGEAVPYPELFCFLLHNKILWPPDARQPFSVCAAHRPADFERLAFLLRKFFQKE